MENHTSKHFVLQLGSLASLYISLAFLLVLLFGVINSAFPDATDAYWRIDSYSEGIRLGIAFLVVFFPTYLVLTRMVNKNRRESNDNNYLGLTKWLIYLSLLVGGAVLLGDLVAVIMAFLDGELTTRFILKAAAVVVVVGSAFSYYIYDARGHWIHNEAKSKFYAAIATALVVAAVVAGFIYTESPSEARERDLDQRQLSDLQDMQWRIEDYTRSNEQLPENLTMVYGEFDVPAAPEDREAYRYEVTGDMTYQLCANFSTESRAEESYARPMMGMEKNYDWRYKSGDWCFEREIDDEYRQ